MVKKVLFCNEFSLFSTGYSTYGKEVLSRLHETGKYEIAEFAAYIRPDDRRTTFVPWKVYGNEPTNPEERRVHDATPLAEFGSWKFEEVALDFKPDIVCDIRDEWMVAFEGHSPFRPCFNWLIMPTVDAEPQLESWLDTYSGASKVFTYSDWGYEVLRKSGLKNLLGAASPSASPEFKLIPNAKQYFGLDPNIKIVGTVMRNQRRKLYPNLFKAFRRFLNNSGRNDVFLYCHTSYPDAGWDIPFWIKEFDLSTRILFTYICKECLYVYPSLFNDVRGKCTRCGGNSMLPNVRAGVSNEVLALIYNMFDLYVQYANSEGFGMPMVEAAACHVPVAATDYSAMSDVVRKINGFPINVLEYAYEPESGCKRAIPNDLALAELLEHYLSRSEDVRQTYKKSSRAGFEQNYGSWDNTAKLWEKAIDDLPYGDWNKPSRAFSPNTQVPSPQVPNSEFVRWLLTDVLGEPERVNSYFGLRMIRDLNAEYTQWGPGGYYFNENSIQIGKPKFDEFDRNKAYNHILHILQRKNMWETKRCSKN